MKTKERIVKDTELAAVRAENERLRSAITTLAVKRDEAILLARQKGCRLDAIEYAMVLMAERVRVLEAEVRKREPSEYTLAT